MSHQSEIEGASAVEIRKIADGIISLDNRAQRLRLDLMRMTGRYEQAQRDVGEMMDARDEARRERDALGAVVDAGRQMLPEAIETLRWIAHGHTDEIETVRDVAKRRLASLGVLV